jgi:hypothetical protein
MPKLHVPVAVADEAALPPAIGIPGNADQFTPSTLASNCTVAENVPDRATVAAVVESVGLLNRVSEMQAFVTAQVEPEAVMFPVELICPKAAPEKAIRARRKKISFEDFMAKLERRRGLIAGNHMGIGYGSRRDAVAWPAKAPAVMEAAPEVVRVEFAQPPPVVIPFGMRPERGIPLLTAFRSADEFDP